jgi:hypothetical protein
MASIKISDLRSVGSEFLLDSQLFQALTDEEAKKIVGGLETDFKVYQDGVLISSTSDGVDNGVTIEIYKWTF